MRRQPKEMVNSIATLLSPKLISLWSFVFFPREPPLRAKSDSLSEQLAVSTLAPD